MKKIVRGTAVVLPLIATAIIIGWTPGTAADAGGDSDPATGEASTLMRRYGKEARIGNGVARTYVVFDTEAGQRPVEVGVAIDAAGMYGLPDTELSMQLALPELAPAPYRAVMFGWNPHGHEPEGVYTIPHFDFHFHTTTPHEVHAIDPSDPGFAEKANRVPTGEFVPEHFMILAAPGDPPASVAVPQMGVHWSDVRSPELQAIFGNVEGAKRFDRTFIYGSWDGRFTFLEPMITRDHLLSQPREIIPIPKPTRYDEPGWYPGAYRIEFDTQASEYRIGITGLEWHE